LVEAKGILEVYFILKYDHFFYRKLKINNPEDGQNFQHIYLMNITDLLIEKH